MTNHSRPMTRKPRTKKNNPLEGTNGQLMVMAAHRYCLGRRTYIVGACCEWLRANWDLIDENSKGNIVRDTILCLMDGDAGMECDVADWTQLARWAFDELNEEKQQWVRDAVSYKRKEWPL